MSRELLANLIFCCGIGQLSVLIASALVPIRLNWRQELGVLSRLHRQMYWVYGGYVVLSIGVVCRHQPRQQPGACGRQRLGSRLLCLRGCVLGCPPQLTTHAGRETTLEDLVVKAGLPRSQRNVCVVHPNLRLDCGARRKLVAPGSSYGIVCRDISQASRVLRQSSWP